MITDNRKGTLFICTDILGYIKKITKSIQRTKNLQAISSTTQFHSLFSYALKCVKRVSLRLSVGVKASISIEASVAVPVFLFCFLEILSLLNYLSVYSGVLYALKSAVEPMAVYAYAYDEMVEDNRDISVGENIVTSLMFSEVYLNTQIQKMCNSILYENTINGGAKGIRVTGSYVNQSADCVDAIAYYSVKPIIPFTGMKMFMMNRYYTKMWTGYSSEQTVGQTKYVYVTDNKSVYHTSESCTHLKLSISGVETNELSSLRNSAGETYSKCDKCCKDNYEVGICYITKQGDKYHKELGCSGLKRTIYCVKIEEAEGLPLCSRCSQDEVE